LHEVGDDRDNQGKDRSECHQSDLFDRSRQRRGQNVQDIAAWLAMDMVLVCVADNWCFNGIFVGRKHCIIVVIGVRL
jgi:hypothetical protein